VPRVRRSRAAPLLFNWRRAGRRTRRCGRGIRA